MDTIPKSWLDPKCAFFVCNELDCGFKFRYKNGTDKSWRGPVSYNPRHIHNVYVNALNKRVRIELVGWGETGLKVLFDMGHEDYIFPVNLYRFKNIDPKLEGADAERWNKLIAAYKGEFYVPYRKEYKLVDKDGIVYTKKWLNELELSKAIERCQKTNKEYNSTRTWELVS